jgi:hypothetical protein
MVSAMMRSIQKIATMIMVIAVVPAKTQIIVQIASVMKKEHLIFHVRNI